MSFTSIETANHMAAVEKKRREGGDVMGTMTLRDYFAAKAMQTIIGSKTASSLLDGGYMATAISSYAMADAMLKARNQ